MQQADCTINTKTSQGTQKPVLRLHHYLHRTRQVSVAHVQPTTWSKHSKSEYKLQLKSYKLQLVWVRLTPQKKCVCIVSVCLWWPHTLGSVQIWMRSFSEVSPAACLASGWIDNTLIQKYFLDLCLNRVTNTKVIVRLHPRRQSLSEPSHSILSMDHRFI